MTTDFSAADHHAMALAIDASRQALEAGDMPFGATLTDAQGRVLWVARNNQVSAQDCMGHAETVLVQEVQKPWARRCCRAARSMPAASPAPCAAARCSGPACAAWSMPPPPRTLPRPWPGAARHGGTGAGPAAPAVTVQGGLQRDAAAQVLQAKAQA
jgi:hypothetical protein